MLQYLGGHFKNNWFRRHETESFMFYMNYRVTFLLLMACCITVTSNLFAGEPIVCTKTPEVSAEVIASYCWSHSTYSIRTAYDKKIGKEIPYPGVDTSEQESDFIYRDYYQWVYLVLLIQGIFFYIPHSIWKTWESGKMKHLGEKLANPPPIYSTTPEEDAKRTAAMSHDDKLYAAAAFFSKRLGWYNCYAYGYWFCELLSYLNIILQSMFLDVFFQGEFTPLGGRALHYFRSFGFHDSPMSWIFPRVTKCNFRKFGPSGKVDTADVLCVLPINALSEKIYLFLWFWFLILFIFTSIGILKTMMTIVIPKVRGLRLSMINATSQNPANDVGRRCAFGDWYVLTVLAKRMDTLDFKMFLSAVRQEMPSAQKKKLFGKSLFGNKRSSATAV